MSHRLQIFFDSKRYFKEEAKLLKENHKKTFSNLQKCVQCGKNMYYILASSILFWYLFSFNKLRNKSV